MNRVIVWNSCHNYHISLGKLLGARWFRDVDLINNFEEPVGMRYNPGFKVVFTCLIRVPTRDLSWANLVVVFTDEQCDPYNSCVAGFRDQYNNSNVVVAAGGVKLNYDHKQYHKPDWLFCPATSFANYLIAANQPRDIDFVSDRPYLFDALLGGIKPHRKYIFNRLQEDNLLDKSLVNLSSGPYDRWYANNSYGLDYQDPVTAFTSPGLLDLEEDSIREYRPSWSGEIQKNASIAGLVGFTPLMSCIVPHKIYAASWFSIVCETEYDNTSFFTEKTFKPLFSQRVFVCFAPPGHLALLKTLGFQTFDGIIDEEYDNQIDNNQRANMAWQQVKLLAASDPRAIYQQAKEILDHNRQVLLNLPYNNLSAIGDFVQSHLDRLK